MRRHLQRTGEDLHQPSSGFGNGGMVNALYRLYMELLVIFLL